MLTARQTPNRPLRDPKYGLNCEQLMAGLAKEVCIQIRILYIGTHNYRAIFYVGLQALLNFLKLFYVGFIGFLNFFQIGGLGSGYF